MTIPFLCSATSSQRRTAAPSAVAASTGAYTRPMQNHVRIQSRIGTALMSGAYCGCYLIGCFLAIAISHGHQPWSTEGEAPTEPSAPAKSKKMAAGPRPHEEFAEPQPQAQKKGLPRSLNEIAWSQSDISKHMHMFLDKGPLALPDMPYYVFNADAAHEPQAVVSQPQAVVSDLKRARDFSFFLTMAANQWTLGRCHWRFSHQCDGKAKPDQVTCGHCRMVLTKEQEEETKQAYDGVYCSTFECWKQSVISWGACRKHRNNPQTPATPPQAAQTQPWAMQAQAKHPPPPPPNFSPADAATGAGPPQALTPQARTPQAQTPARTPSPGVRVPQNLEGQEPLDLNHIVDTATTDELRDLIILASHRMHYLLQGEPYQC